MTAPGTLTAGEAREAALQAENARLEERATTAERQLAEARETLRFFASVIMSGEPWTEVCERRYRAALAPAATGNMQEADCGPVCKRWFDAEAGRWVCGHPNCRGTGGGNG